MRILDFIVSGQKIERDPKCDFSNIASGSRGYLRARFRFSADWKGCKCAAIFSCRGHDIIVPLENSICDIPDAALIGSTVGVKIVGQNGKAVIPTNKVCFEQSKGV